MPDWKHTWIIAELAGAIGLFILATVSGAHASPSQPDTGSPACTLRAVTVTADLVWDPLPGTAADRVIYFSNFDTSGTLTVSALVSDFVTTCYVWASAAFSTSQETRLTATLNSPAVDFVYPLSSDHSPTATVILTSSSNITGSFLPPHQLVMLTFVRDTRPFKLQLPIVVRDYGPLINGDFEQGWIGWTHGQGPFDGHGSGLPQSIVLAGTYRALLGDPRYDDPNQNYHIPVGYAYISQEFTVPPGAPILSISYRVHSLDVSFGMATTQFFDTFEVSLNETPNQVSDSERSGTNGCRGTALNPDDVTRTLTSSGLAACGGAPQTHTIGTPWDPGWYTVRLNLSAFVGQDVTLYLSNWNREYDPPYRDDHGFFNTYTYLDDIKLVPGP